MQQIIGQCAQALGLKANPNYQARLFKSSKSGKWHLALEDEETTWDNKGVLCGTTNRGIIKRQKEKFKPRYGSVRKYTGMFESLEWYYGIDDLIEPLNKNAIEINCSNCKRAISNKSKEICFRYGFDWDSESIQIAKDVAEEVSDHKACHMLNLKMSIGWMDKNGKVVFEKLESAK